MAGEIQLNSVTLATESGGVASIDSSVNIKGPLNASGSAPIYACRAWVNFNGTGTVAIRQSGNVSSITDNGGSGDYTVNFTTAMPDANYSVNCTSMRNFTGTGNTEIGHVFNNTTYSNSYLTNSIRVKSTDYGGNGLDPLAFNLAVFR